MIGPSLDEIKNRKNFYRNNFRRAGMMLWFATIVIFVLTVIIIYQDIRKPAPYYYATSSDGRITQLIPVPRGTGLLDPENS